MSLILINFMSTESPPSMFSLHQSASTSKASETLITSCSRAIRRKRSKKCAGTPGRNVVTALFFVPSCIEKPGISMIFNWDFMGPKQGMWICSATRCWSLCSKANHPQLLPPKITIRNGPNKIHQNPHPQTLTAPQGFRNSGSLVRVLQDDKPASQRRSSSSSLCRNAEVRTKPTNSASICGWNLMKFGWKMVGKA